MPHTVPRPLPRERSRPTGPRLAALRVRPAAPRALAAACALVLALTGCTGGASGGADPAASGDAPGIPDLAENRLQILEEPAAPELPVTVDSVVLDPYRTSSDPLEYEQVEVTDASRVLPLTGSLAEIVFTLGLGDNVVGRDVGATFEEAAHLPTVSEAHEVSAESVLSLEPTVVLADTQTGPPEAIEQIQSSGVPVVIVEEAWSIDDMYPRFERVAEALGVPASGTALAERTRGQMAEVRADSTAVSGDPLVAFLYLRGTAGVYLLGGPGSGADAMLAEIGARDAGVEMGLTTPFTPITTEALIAAQPDVLLVMTKGLESVGGIEGLVQIPGVAQTPAGAARAVVDFEDGVLLNFGPRTPQVVAALADELAAVSAGEGER
ncbi:MULTISPECIES: heme/hemin ABC transporter substrate-binding protein [Nocardiopsis]|uniref:Periplasmic binding protein n=1 Tax=Nocardiopsis dassonvillei (strain ATCC 23218 / DSM 43111 / CIP 107115 / JCM 7437 / KCTC 9190 / NBRC 14626 / NCTC 10488 / NRRL B-5397 / IMRU 509) TaxID=446468 RepID=D7AVF8_NOCDD|nr:ABC transporter substrate-binding protein [Nocardiopsis dassonvillei]ADH65819.1 periplasmic binding protein [Nocardiopsis dassonvillei subsp. dassonvillei DSM 43111]NKY78759.1 ABC transporter substrate-binding protein [Nocardiopsis dassonvillei]VEI91840.1 Hemin-binding periplasmic protein hmuT precursor [Nocardiopsis dassonvillei]